MIAKNSFKIDWPFPYHHPPASLRPLERHLKLNIKLTRSWTSRQSHPRACVVASGLGSLSLLWPFLSWNWSPNCSFYPVSGEVELSFREVVFGHFLQSHCLGLLWFGVFMGRGKLKFFLFHHPYPKAIRLVSFLPPFCLAALGLRGCMWAFSCSVKCSCASVNGACAFLGGGSSCRVWLWGARAQ